MTVAPPLYPMNDAPGSGRVESLTDLLAVIAADPAIALADKTRVAKHVGRLFDLDPVLRVTRPLGLCVEPRLKRLHSTNTGLQQKTLENYKSALRWAIKHHHNVHPGATRGGGFVGEYQVAYELLPAKSASRVVLSPVLRWCQVTGTSPHAFSNRKLEQYDTYLRDVRGESKSYKRIRTVALHWNRSREIPGWPQQILTPILPVRPERAVKPTTMGPALAAELDTYLSFLRAGHAAGEERGQFDLSPDDAEDDERRKEFQPLKESTIRNHYFGLRRAVGLLSTVTGLAPDQLHLADLVTIQNAPRILAEYKSQLGDNPCAAALESMAYFLVKLGRYFKIDQKGQNFLDRLAKAAIAPALQEARKSGPSKMTKKNLARLRQFGPKQLRALFQLPAVLLKGVEAQVRAGTAKPSDMVDGEAACAIAALVHVPMRGQNIASIEVGVQLILPATDDAESILSADGSAVKNGLDLNFRLPPDVTALLRRYMNNIRPYFGRTSLSAMLFPGAENQHKSVNCLGAQISKRVQRATGVAMNQHLFRHLCALLFLRRNPGNYVAVQRLLGHRSLKTTMEYYCGAEVDALLEQITASMAGIKSEYGLDPKDMSRVTDAPKRRRRTPTTPKPVAAKEKAPWAKLQASAVSGIGSAHMAMPGARGSS
jgi:hypothetical protein